MVVLEPRAAPAVDRTDRVLHALSDATRRDIVRKTLVEELSVTQLARHYPMSFAAVQKHVAVLERAEVVTKRRRGREALVRSERAAISDARQALAALEELWRARIDRMGEVLADPDRKDGKP